MCYLYRAIQKYFLISLLTCLTLIGCQSTLPEPPIPSISPGVLTLVKVTGMTEWAQQIFLEQQPSLISSKAFYPLCSSRPGHESSVILGCFTRKGGEGRIYIQSIKDKRLKGTMEVVAAHEMLHAAYSQLSPAAKETLTPKLEQAAKYYDNPSILPILQEYQRQAPDVYINELHSYLGTDLKDFRDTELETYYKRYFKERNRLVELAQSSQNELYTYQRRAKELEAQISTLKSFLKSEKEYLTRAVQDIKQFETNLAQQQRTIESQITQQNRQISQGQYNSLSEFESAQNQRNQASRRIENMIRDYQNRSLDYEEKVDEYNSLVNEYTNLTKNREEILKIIQS